MQVRAWTATEAILQQTLTIEIVITENLRKKLLNYLLKKGEAILVLMENIDLSCVLKYLK